MGVFLIILVAIFLLWPWIVKWLRGYMARRAEDMMRRMAGMPPRKEEERRRREQNRERRSERKRREAERRAEDGLRSMREYAEDVEFTEVREFSESTIIGQEESGKRRVYSESQVSDAEYTEIRERSEK